MSEKFLENIQFYLDSGLYRPMKILFKKHLMTKDHLPYATDDVNKNEEYECEEHQAFKRGIDLKHLHHAAHELVIYLSYPEYLHKTRDLDQLLKFSQAGQPRDAVDP
jgi:hypothetical protein